MWNAVRHRRARTSLRGSAATVIATLAGPLALAVSSLAHTAVTLPAYNADVSQTSISSLSSGAFMAVQLHVAYSATFKDGAGIVAGSPFMDEANAYYKNYVTNTNIFYKNNIASEHAMVTDYFGSGCSVKGSPYINNCNFDLAGDMLKWIYGSLNPKNTGTLGGSFVEFNQTDFISSPTTHGMANTGWLYVPATCSSNQACKVHVVLHSCQQDPTKIQDQYCRNTRYNKWSDTNNIIVLYP